MTLCLTAVPDNGRHIIHIAHAQGLALKKIVKGRHLSKQKCIASWYDEAENVARTIICPRTLNLRFRRGFRGSKRGARGVRKNVRNLSKADLVE